MNRDSRRNLCVSIVFFTIICTLFAGTLMGMYSQQDKYIKTYSSYLAGDAGQLAKTKAVLLTGYETFSNINKNVFPKNIFIDLYGLTQRVTGNRCVYETGEVKEVVKLEDGSITFIMKQQKDLTKKAEHIQAFNKQLQQMDIDLLYVQYPFKINKFDKGLPAGVEDYSNENADEILAQLNGRGVATFDLRDEIAKEFPVYDSLFFKTDHHWKPETGLWVAKKIAEKLNESFAFQIDTAQLDKSRFVETIYKNQFLGSMGKRVGRYYAGLDDFSLLLPSYQTDMSNFVTCAAGGTFVKQGSFEQTFIFSENLSIIDYFTMNTFITYSGGDYPLSVCKNNLIAGKKILVLRDSYSCVVTPFLSLAACNELHIIDPRLYKDSITGYIKDINPDIVLMLYNPGALKEKCFFEF